MAIAESKGYMVRHIKDAPTVPCPCGSSTRPLTAVDGGVCNLHVTHITDSVKHYHRNCTEVYYILEGQGKMELDDDVIDLTPGTVVYVPPGTAHRAYGDIRTIVFGVPAYHHDDEFFVTS